MVAERIPRFITPAEYLHIERAAEGKSEYVNGSIYAMAGASTKHNCITASAMISIGSQLRGRSCQPFGQDMRLRVPETSLYAYPDLMIVCGPLEFDDEKRDTLTNPVVIIEVLSPSTEAYDRGGKFAHYRRLASLQDYVLVAQETSRIEHFERQPDNSWLLRVAEKDDEFVELKSIGCRLNVAEVYERVTFETASETL